MIAQITASRLVSPVTAASDLEARFVGTGVKHMLNLVCSRTSDSCICCMKHMDEGIRSLWGTSWSLYTVYS